MYIYIYLTRGLVCKIELLLGLASTAVLGSESVGYLNLETPPTEWVRVLYLFPPGMGSTVIPPRHLVG
jgi:hypothetical protein